MIYTDPLDYLPCATTISKYLEYLLIYTTPVLFIGTILYLSSKMDLRNLLNTRDAIPRTPRDEDINNVIKKLTFQFTTTPWFNTNTRPNIYHTS